MPIRAASLELRLGAVHARGFGDDDVGRVRDLLLAADEWTLDHLNPFELAARGRLDADRTIELLAAMRDAGALALRFNTICVFCGATERRFDRLESSPRDRFRCELCDADISVRDGERIEAAFTVAPAIGRADADPFESFAAYRRRFVSSAIVPSQEFAAYLGRALRAQAVVRASESVTLSLSLAPGESLRAVSYDRHATARLRAVGASQRSSAVLRASDAGWSAVTTRCPPGFLELVVANEGKRPMGVLVLDGDTDAYHHAIGEHPPTRRPFLSAKDAVARGLTA